MKTILSKALVLLFVIASLASCRSKQELAYFYKHSDADTLNLANYSIKIQPADELIITVNSLIPEASYPYNLPVLNPAHQGSIEITTTTQNQTYTVDKEGYITFPILGKIHVEGLSTQEIAQLLTDKISEAVDQPIVRVQLVNFRINVLGEVMKPGAIQVKTERFSVLDALAAVGDLTVYGKRDNVLLIREENGERQFHRLNLNEAAIVNSPYFYLQQNDVIYVEPSNTRKSNSEYNQNNSFKIQIASTVVSVISVMSSLIIALVINR